MEKFKIKKDCILYSDKRNTDKGYCTGLNHLYCEKEECNFYKSKENFYPDGSLKKIK